MNVHEILQFKYTDAELSTIAELFSPFLATRTTCEQAWAEYNREIGFAVVGVGDTDEVVRCSFLHEINRIGKNLVLQFSKKEHKMPSAMAAKAALEKIADAAARLDQVMKDTHPQLLSALWPLPIRSFLPETIEKARFAANAGFPAWMTTSHNLPKTKFAFQVLDLFRSETGQSITSSKSGNAAKALAAVMNPVLKKFPSISQLTVRLDGETPWGCVAAEELIRKYLKAVAGQNDNSP